MTWFGRLKRWSGVAPQMPLPDARCTCCCDELTALSTRAMMHDTLAAALRSGVRGAVALLDVDRFGHFNERHGRGPGDELLRAIAALLREELSSASCLARAGGDRFVAFLPGLDLDAAMRLAQRCVEAMREPVILSCGPETITLSVGVAALDGEPGRAAEAVWDACDRALRAARARGPGRADS